MTKSFEFFNVKKKFPEEKVEKKEFKEFQVESKSSDGFQLGPLNFSLEPGVVQAYIGPNGGGKTTTIHCITGLLKPDSGEVHVFGQPNDPNKPSWKYNIGYVGDKHVFYEKWSVAKNLKFTASLYPDWSNKKAAELIERFKLPLGKKAKDLSTGNRVKLALVQALSYSPKLLLLDEPTAGLDPLVRDQLLEVLFEVLQDEEKSIFYSTHVLSDIDRIADELVFINNGNIYQRKSKEDLLHLWRTISFRLGGNHEMFNGAVDIKTEGSNHKIISSDAHTTLRHLQELGAKSINEVPMGIDEIALQILKGGENVAPY